MLTRMKNNNNRKTSSFDRSVRNCLSSRFVRSMNHTCHCCANNKHLMAHKQASNHHGGVSNNKILSTTFCTILQKHGYPLSKTEIMCQMKILVSMLIVLEIMPEEIGSCALLPRLFCILSSVTRI